MITLLLWMNCNLQKLFSRALMVLTFSSFYSHEPVYVFFFQYDIVRLVSIQHPVLIPKSALLNNHHLPSPRKPPFSKGHGHSVVDYLSLFGSLSEPEPTLGYRIINTIQINKIQQRDFQCSWSYLGESQLVSIISPLVKNCIFITLGNFNIITDQRTTSPFSQQKALRQTNPFQSLQVLFI